MISKLRTVFFLNVVILLAACTSARIKINDDLKKYFDDNKVDGSFSMMNNANGEVTVYNMKMNTTQFSPASTFKIVNSLIGLETGDIINDSMIIKWDGVTRSHTEWNRDLNMIDAFKLSAVPYYQEVARRIGKDTMKFWIDSIQYGNRNINGAVDSFWLNNQLKISPDEQLGLVKRLYFDQLPFRKSVQENVKEVMLQENNTAYKLSYKTGWGNEENGNDIGWVTGWIEENQHVYFFVTFVRANNKTTDIAAVRMNITKSILKRLGFFEGKM